MRASDRETIRVCGLKEMRQYIDVSGGGLRSQMNKLMNEKRNRKPTLLHRE